MNEKAFFPSFFVFDYLTLLTLFVNFLEYLTHIHSIVTLCQKKHHTHINLEYYVPAPNIRLSEILKIIFIVSPLKAGRIRGCDVIDWLGGRLTHLLKKQMSEQFSKKMER